MKKNDIPSTYAKTEFSPYAVFNAHEWAKFRADEPLTLTSEEVDRLRSLNDPVNLREVKRIYLALSRLIFAHVEAAQNLHQQRNEFLEDSNAPKTPYIIGIAGSVAVGKSTTARVLRELLARWPSSPKVELITTDGFLLSNAELKKKGLMEKKGFPQSFDRHKLLRFLKRVKAGRNNIKAPVYSHLEYDVIPKKTVTISQPDILIVEGINVFQANDLPKDGNSIPFVSDYFDFSIYIDADPELIQQWYIERFMSLRKTAFLDERSFFHDYSKVSDKKAKEIATGLWKKINLKNLRQNILPTRLRADVVLHKGDNHKIDFVALRKL